MKTSRKRIYVGYKAGGLEVFRSESEPTRESHGDRYPAVIGPFRTIHGARFMAAFGMYNNPHCRCVEEAERCAARKLESSPDSRNWK